MNLPTIGLRIAPEAAIDLQLHTADSDGDWLDEELLDYLIAEGFSLAAITDHDRVDTARGLQKLISSTAICDCPYCGVMRVC